MIGLLVIISIFSTHTAAKSLITATDASLHRTRECETNSISQTSVANTTRRSSPITIYDVSFLLDEIELLEIRLYELRNVVDKFIIVEQNETHTGLPKQLTFKENYGRLLRTLGQHTMRKVEYVECIYPPELKIAKTVIGSSNQQSIHWLRENYMRKICAQAPLAKMHERLQMPAYVMVSDMDEIPDMLAVASFKYCHFSESSDKIEPKLVGFKQMRYHFNFHCASSNMYEWSGTVLAKIDTAMEMGLQTIRDRRTATDANVLLGWGGWHFSNFPFGDPKKLVSKYTSFAESQTIDHIKDGDLLAYWRHTMNNGGDIKSNTHCEERELRHFPRLVADDPMRFVELLSAAQRNRLID